MSCRRWMVRKAAQAEQRPARAGGFAAITLMMFVWACVSATAMPGAVAQPPSLDQLLLAKAADAPAVDIRILIRRGANVNVQGRFGVTPLMQAVIGNNIAVVRLLLTTGADPNLRNLRGDTALDLARLLGRRNIEQILAAASKVRDSSRVSRAVPKAAAPDGTLEQLLVRMCAYRTSRQPQSLQSQHPECSNGQIPGTHQCS